MSDTVSTTSALTRSSRTWHIVLWVLQVLAAASFLLAGGLKIIGDSSQVTLFAAIGVGQWFRYLTGILEVLGAIALLIPRLRALGAIGLVGVMIGALITNLFIVPFTPVPALVNLVVVGVIAWGRRRELPLTSARR